MQILMFPLPVAFALILLGMDIGGVGMGFIMLYSLDNVGKLYFAHRQCGQSIRHWMRRVFMPVLSVVIASTAAALLPRYCFDASFLRVVLTTASSLAVFSLATWFIVLSPLDREKIVEKVRQLL